MFHMKCHSECVNKHARLNNHKALRAGLDLEPVREILKGMKVENLLSD